MPDIKSISRFLREYDGEPVTLMEVCGTHTAAISENGIPDILSDKIRLVSGPGCPVCVTVEAYIDKLVSLSGQKDTCVVTFGDMMRVRGTRYSLSEAAAEGGNTLMVYSPLDMIEHAINNPGTDYVFAAVGFETTTPLYGLLLDEVIKRNINNIKILTALKTMPEAIRKVSRLGGAIDGFIAPGHVSVITGSDEYARLADELSLPFAVAGFTGPELLAAIYSLVKTKGRGVVKNLYPSAVTAEGNVKARKTTNKYFRSCAAAWRGLGVIENSGMVLRDEYKQYDAGSEELVEDAMFNKGCSCGEVVVGIKSPTQCPLYGKVCTPASPQGACMVSTEGSCYNYYVNKRK